jgi:penicillin-binding protein 1A
MQGPLAHWSGRRKWLLSTATVLAAVVGVIAVEIHVNGAYFFVACHLDRLQARGVARSSSLYSADGVRFATLGAPVVHTAVPLGRIDPKLQKATVAIEDRRFYHEGGTDWIAVLRAGVADITSAKLAQGGSTLTQQLVRNLYLGDERTVARKLQEGCLADRLAHRWSKQHVLDSYLNTVFYGQQAYGVQAAAQTYFSTSATRLTLPQAALIAGLPQAPTVYDPLRDPAAARARRQEVLKAMLANGDIDDAAYRRAARAPLGLRPSPIGKQQPESFFVNYVYEQLVNRYGAAAVRRGGLAVHTTLDWRSQQAAERAIERTLDRPHDPAAALVAVDPATGAVRAMASVVPGKPRYEFNLAVQGKRQAGSSFKLFVLTDAILRGVNPFTTTYLSAPFRGPAGNPYLIRTDTRTYTGRTRLDAATAESDNTVFVRLTLDLGDASVAATAHRLGVRGGGGSGRSCDRSTRSGSESIRCRPSRWRPRMRPSRPAACITRRTRSRPCRSRTATPTAGGRREADSVCFRPRSQTRSRVCSRKSSRTGPGGPPTSDVPQRARPARRARWRTPGSTATRPASPQPSGSAIRRPACR